VIIVNYLIVNLMI